MVGRASDYFTVCGGVEQGAAMSPISFCVYTLTTHHSRSCPFRCWMLYIGLNFVGALAYADSIVGLLVSPNPSAMRKTHVMIFAFRFNVVFKQINLSSWFLSFMVDVPYVKISATVILKSEAI